MNRQDTIKMIEDQKIIVVIRGIYGEELLKLVGALYRGGSALLRSPTTPLIPIRWMLCGKI